MDAKQQPRRQFKNVLDDLMTWVSLKRIIKDAERDLNDMKAPVLLLVPPNQEEEHIPGPMLGQPGVFTIKRIAQDRRKVDDGKLKDLLESKGLFARACRVVPDQDKVAELVEAGKLTKEEIAECFVGTMPVYATVEWKPKK